MGRSRLLDPLRGIDVLHADAPGRGDRVPLGDADEQKPAAEGSVEAWASSDSDPVEHGRTSDRMRALPA